VSDVLVLNFTYEALNVTSFQRAVKMLFAGKAELLHGRDRTIASTTYEMRMPSIIRMLYYIRRPMQKVALTKKNVLIRDDHTFVVLVTTAESERVDQAIEFIEALKKLGLKLGAVAVNRLMTPLPDEAAIASADLPTALKRKLKRNLNDFAALHQRETSALLRLRDNLRAGTRLIAAPDLGREPRTLADLAEIARSLHDL